jgi:hypothetical protein
VTSYDHAALTTSTCIVPVLVPPRSIQKLPSRVCNTVEYTYFTVLRQLQSTSRGTLNRLTTMSLGFANEVVALLFGGTNFKLKILRTCTYNTG